MSECSYRPYVWFSPRLCLIDGLNEMSKKPHRLQNIRDGGLFSTWWFIQKASEAAREHPSSHLATTKNTLATP